MSFKIYKKDKPRVRKIGEKGTWGARLLNRFKTINGKLYQLHATKGWRVAKN